MSNEGSSSGLSQSFGFQIVMLALSVYAIGALLVDMVADLPPNVSQAIQRFDLVVCGFFLVDFFIQLFSAPRKAAFLKFGWIDLLASIPSIDVLRWGRMARVLRIFRVLRAVRGSHKIWKTLVATRANAGGSATASVFLLIAFSSISILIVEDTPEANIKTAEDAIWWSFTTISTVGYGDHYPTTTEGRIIAVILMVAGVGVLGSFTAFIASYFIGVDEVQEEKDTQAELRALHDKIDALHRLLAEKKTLSAGDGQFGGKSVLAKRLEQNEGDAIGKV